MEGTDNLLGTIFVLLPFVFLLLFVGSIAWTWSDANQRGKTGCLWALLVFVAWPLGVIAYLLLREREVRL